jgi:alkylated DNA repair protein alkB family protein 8
VWATQQEDPAKTIQRWHKIQPAAADQEQQQQPPEGSGVVEQQEGGVVEGPDYFVPWHLPFHKAGGLTASAQQQQQQQQPIGPNCGSSAAPAGPPSLAVDNSKRAVVLQRYYHLFEQGELESLVGEVHGLQVVQGFYDRSNWCVEFVKQAQ